MSCKDRLKEQLCGLVDSYSENRESYLKSSYNETSLRVDFLNPLFQCLGWDVNNEQGLSPFFREVVHESNVLVDESGVKYNKKPDYAFRAGGETKFFLEAKKPSVNLLKDKDPSFQARRYGWSASHSVVVLSNFEDTIVYDCSYRPDHSQDPAFARLCHFHYDEYIVRFEELYDLLSKNAVSSGSLSKINATEAQRKEPFDEYFLSQIRDWRMKIGEDVFGNYQISNESDLDLFTQSIINRIVFLRVCEDRSLEQYEQLKAVKSFAELKELFAVADERYDSGLFDYLHDSPWNISSELLVEIFQELYFPFNSYDFNVVQPHIIGQIYEQFLSEHLIIDGEWVILAETVEVSDSNGVVPTPKPITDIIVSKTIEDVSHECRVIDICCGSGNFLLSSFELLIEKKIQDAIKTGSFLIQRESGWDLPFVEKRELLQNSIYGVDIDPLAVEVAKFSLLLRLLEGYTKEELDSYRDATGNSVLPDLSSNIKWGNSLVDYNIFNFDSTLNQNRAKLQRICPFDWDEEFPGIKFDAVVGNPPYIRVQKMALYTPDEYEYYRSPSFPLQVASAGLLDKYQLFVERGLSLLKEGGKLGYIIPNKFMTNKHGQLLRELLTNNYSVVQIIDFSKHQIFPGKSTYTCILVASTKHKQGQDASFKRMEVDSVPSFIEDSGRGLVTYPLELLTSEPWSFPPEHLVEKLKNLKDKTVYLQDLANVFVGLQTSNDDAYIIDPDSVSPDGMILFTAFDGNQYLIEKDITRPCILDVQLEMFSSPNPNKLIIFPYEFNGEKAVVIPAEKMREMYPAAYRYFSAIKDVLAKRAVSPACKDNDWFKFGRSQSIAKFSGKPHLIWTVLSLEPKYAIDYSGSVMFTGGGNGPFYGLELKNETRESIEYIQAVLGYDFSEQLLRSGASVFSGGYYSHGKQYVERVPIRKIDFADKREQDCHDLITAKVKELNRLMIDCRNQPSPTERKIDERLISAARQLIDEQLDLLYSDNICNKG